MRFGFSLVSLLLLSRQALSRGLGQQRLSFRGSFSQNNDKNSNGKKRRFTDGFTDGSELYLKSFVVTRSRLIICSNCWSHLGVQKIDEVCERSDDEREEKQGGSTKQKKRKRGKSKRKGHSEPSAGPISARESIDEQTLQKNDEQVGEKYDDDDEEKQGGRKRKGKIATYFRPSFSASQSIAVSNF